MDYQIAFFDYSESAEVYAYATSISNSFNMNK